MGLALFAPPISEALDYHVPQAEISHRDTTVCPSPPPGSCHVTGARSISLSTQTTGPPMIVSINRNELDYFRTRARNSHNEIHAYLIGSVSKNRITVDGIVHSHDLDLQTPSTVQPSEYDYQQAKAVGEYLNRKIIGDIHSHPNSDPEMSDADHKAAIEDELTVCGIVSVRKRRTKVRFWLVNSSLSCDIDYRGKA
jgi:proteasome lid subunit RPN8/RPN11